MQAEIQHASNPDTPSQDLDREAQLDSAAVLRYLNQNPDFFNHHEDILAQLKIPHHAGTAVSLVEKQISVLRKQCNSLESKLNEFILVARDNEQLHQRLHKLIQDIISAESLADISLLLKHSLTENFNTDDVKLLLLDHQGGTQVEKEPDRFIDWNDPRLEMFDQAFLNRETLCGAPSESVRDLLFNERENNLVKSAAVIPLHHEQSLGLAVLMSRDETRFNTDQGVMFLNQLGEVLSRRIASLFPKSL